MSLVKWFRKNNKKVMAVVVIVLMFGFVGGSYLSYLGRASSPLHRAIGYYLDNRKITNYDLGEAQGELETLKSLRADLLLQSQDLQGVLLAELLFSEQRPSPALINGIRQAIGTNGFWISEKQLSDMYRRRMPGRLYWVLLTAEARNAGIRISNDDVGRILANIAPQLPGGGSYSRLIQGLMNRSGIAEKQILTTFGRLLAVLQYTRLMCSSEDVTTSQVMHLASRESESIDIEFVKLDASMFAAEQVEPNEEEMVEQFERYKGYLPGTVSEENPYGFGYKSPDRVRLEYMAVKLGDIEQIVTPPTQEEMEDYYQKNLRLFTEEIPADSNDPNAEAETRTKSYAEVAGEIADELLRSRTDARADRILQEARNLTELDLTDDLEDRDSLSVEQLSKLAGDYAATASELSGKNKISVFTGRTGLLSASDIQNDKYLAGLYLQASGYYPIRLIRILFAVDKLNASELGPVEVAPPKIYGNIGPFKESPARTDEDERGRIMALFRIIEVREAGEPNSIDQSFDTKTLVFDPNDEKGDEKIQSVRQDVFEDLRDLAATATAGARARELVDLAAKEGWEDALQKFNDLYGEAAKAEPNEPNAFQLESKSGLQRISSALLATLAVQSEGNPMASVLMNEFEKNRMFTDQLYSLAPADANVADLLPLVMEFKPDMAFLCLKEISVNRFWKEDFDRFKAMRFFREDNIESQSLAPVFLNPENILKRLRFREVEAPREPADSNRPQGEGENTA